jgi:hypothetical protein
MELTVAVIGAGRMGTFVGRQLPPEVKKIFIDSDEGKARQLAANAGGAYGLTVAVAGEADIIALVLPAPAIDGAARELAASAKDGAVIINMATSGRVAEEVKGLNPSLSFVDAKIIGNAKAMALGFPSCVVVDTSNQKIYEKIKSILPGYTKVVMGDSQLVPQINTIGSAEGIRAAVNIRQQLKGQGIPRDWEDIVIYTVCAGTMMAYVEDDLGEFGRRLAKELETEGEKAK